MTLSAKCGVRLTRKRNCFSPTGTMVASVTATAVALRGRIDQRHFTENAMFIECIEQPIAEPDLDRAVLDHIEFLGRIAFLKDNLAGLEGPHRGAGACQNAKNQRPLQPYPRPLCLT